MPNSCDPRDCSHQVLLSVHEILQARILEWVAIPSPGDLPNPGIKPASLKSWTLVGRFFTTSATWEAPSDFAAGLQFFPVAQTVKNLPAMREMGVRSLGWEDPLEKEW